MTPRSVTVGSAPATAGGVNQGDGRQQPYDVVLVGGGLACSLVALALRRRRPRTCIAMVEAGSELGGNHTWSFHDSDLDEEGAALVAPAVVHRWPAVEVAFADHRRQLPTGYASLTSPSLAAVTRAAMAAPGSWLLLGRRAVEVLADQVALDDGTRLHGALVLDGRGPSAPPTWVENQGFQKFLGLEVEVAGGARLFPPGRALVMDARVPQLEGFRFMYVLPLEGQRLLVEDTYYSDSATIDRSMLRARVHVYLQRHGLQVVRVLREEAGALAIPFTDDTIPPLGSPVRLGARGGWFHPTTGYSLPLATRVALTIAEVGVDQAIFALAALYRRLQPQARFARRLNRLLFRAVAPQLRWQVLSRFYRMPRRSIERFYALQTSPADRARVLLGRPPRGVSLGAAFAALQAV